MKLSWIVLTVLFLLSVAVVGRHLDSLAREHARHSPSAQEASAAQGPGSSAPRTPAGRPHRLADSLDAKLNYIQRNGARSTPDQTPTVMSEDEVNDYLASGRVELPKGVKKVTMQGRSGVVTAFLTVDFDEIRAGQRSSNPLLGLFSGVHNVAVESDASAGAGQGRVQVRTVSIDGVEVPRMALEFFVEKYITPKYPNVGLDSRFKMPNRIDSAWVGYHKVTVTQK